MTLDIVHKLDLVIRYVLYLDSCILHLTNDCCEDVKLYSEISKAWMSMGVDAWSPFLDGQTRHKCHLSPHGRLVMPGPVFSLSPASSGIYCFVSARRPSRTCTIDSLFEPKLLVLHTLAISIRRLEMCAPPSYCDIQFEVFPRAWKNPLTGELRRTEHQRGRLRILSPCTTCVSSI